MNKDYCVAIRTLGTAGAKYKALLDSINVQTVSPKKILVYLPYGYEEPRETIGVEHIIRCEKGMVAQRSLPFEDIDTEYVLFCDDDMYLPADFVEKMFQYLENNNGDCVSSDVYSHEKENGMMKLFVYLHSFTSPRKDDGWAIKIKRNAAFSYNNSPRSNVLPTQSASFACLLCNMNAYNEIHYEDERWLDNFSFASGDDQLFYYKMYLSGYKVLQAYNTGIKHLDARSGVRVDITKKMYYQKKLLFVLWYRSIYNLKRNSPKNKFLCISAYIYRTVLGIFSLFVDTIRYKKPRFIIDYFIAIKDGYNYVHSTEYMKIPLFDEFSQK